MDVALVVNPTAGSGPGRVPERLAERFAQHGIRATLLSSASASDAESELRQVVELGVDAVVVVGGDGTVSLAAQQLVDSGVPLAAVPTGTGNDFAASIGFAGASPETVADAVAAGVTRDIDVATIQRENGDERHVLTAIATGLDAKVNERGNRMRYPHGPMRYRLAVLIELARLKPITYELTTEEGTERIPAILISIGNGPSYGGGIPMLHGALVDDGLLDITIVRPAGRLALMRLLPKLYRGELASIRQVEQRRATSVRVAADTHLTAFADGDAVGPLPLDVQLLPRALRVVTTS